jgi:hypothetical protein
MSDRPRLICRDTIIPCLPGTTSEVTIDTSSSVTGRSSHYLTITQVEGLNTGVDEFSVLFGTSGREALVTARTRGSNRLRADDAINTAAFSRVDKATVQEKITSPRGLERAIGGGARGSQNEIHFATKFPGTISGDYDLAVGTLRDGAITSPVRNGVSAVVPWDAQPALSPNGKILYFASDRKGGFGGVDIWSCQRQSDGRWSDPVNLGPAVNTPCDELSPWVSGNGKWLYFSSAGHATVGGYDIFRSAILSDGEYGKWQNLGQPINTRFDELFASAPSSADPDTLLYYSSDQARSSGFDIYVLHRLPRSGGGKRNTPSREVTMTGTVLDPQGHPVDSALVTIDGGDPPRRDSTRTTSDGRYDVKVLEGHEYEVIAGSDKTLYLREIVRIPITDGRTTYTHDIALPDTVTFRVNFPFNNATDPYEYTLDDRGLPSNLRWVDMIDRAAEFLSRQNRSQNRFEIVGHTDPVGTDAFNLDLGRRRAEFIRRELIKRGVSSSILSIRSEGEGRPLGQMPSEAQELFHARLRRVELVRKK